MVFENNVRIQNLYYFLLYFSILKISILPTSCYNVLRVVIFRIFSKYVHNKNSNEAFIYKIEKYPESRTKNGY